MFLPKRVFLTSGAGVHKDRLTSFEFALRAAGVEKCNLVLVSSILPPNCEILDKEEGLKCLQPGQIAFSAMDQLQTDEGGRMIAAAVGMAVPNDRSIHGYLSEHHAYGQNEETAGKFAEDLTATMLASYFGLPVFESELPEPARSKQYQRCQEKFTTTHIAAVTKGKKGLWTTVFAGAVFID